MPSPLISDLRFDDDMPIGSSGDYLTVEDEDAAWQWIRLCLATAPGEYRHNLAFGVGVPTFLKKPATATNLSEIQRRIRAALALNRKILDVAGVSFDRLDIGTPPKPVFRINLSVVFLGKVTRGRAFDFATQV